MMYDEVHVRESKKGRQVRLKGPISLTEWYMHVANCAAHDIQSWEECM